MLLSTWKMESNHTGGGSEPRRPGLATGLLARRAPISLPSRDLQGRWLGCGRRQLRNGFSLAEVAIAMSIVGIGLAVALENSGLIVPVIKNADSLNIVGLARSTADLAQRARNLKKKS